MNKRKVFIVLGLTLIFTIGIVLANQGTMNAQECRLIRVWGAGPSAAVHLEPEVARISKGTCVVWINWSNKSANIKFEEGKKCAASNRGPFGVHRQGHRQTLGNIVNGDGDCDV